jgi:alpha-beta hydrolase superfamily lysophospholipase
MTVSLGQERLLPAWDEIATAVAAEAQLACVEPAGAARVDAFVGVGGPYDAAAYAGDLAPLLDLATLLENGDRSLQLRLVHGTADTRVAAANSEHALAAATAAGYNAELTLVEGGGHTILSAVTVPLIVALAQGKH